MPFFRRRPQSNSSADSPTYTPCATPPIATPDHDTPQYTQNHTPCPEMEKSEPVVPAKADAEAPQTTETAPIKAESVTPQQASGTSEKKTKKCCRHHAKSKKSKSTVDSSSDSSDSSSSDDSDSESEAEESDDESSEASSQTSGEDRERQKRKEKKKKRLRKVIQEKLRARRKAKAKKRAAVSETESDESSQSSEVTADDEGSSEDEKPKKTKKKAKRGGRRKARKVESDSEEESDADSEEEDARSRKSRRSRKSHKKSRKGKKKSRGSLNSFKRLDQLWDTNVHDWKITETADADSEENHADCAFAVRRKFDWDNKYEATYCDINSKCLKEALAKVFDGVSGVSLVEETPCLDPNMLFLYFDEIKALKKKIKEEAKEMKKKKKKKALLLKVLHLKLLLKYLDEDYSDIRKRLLPMLQNGQITFDLLWALFKPNTIAFTTTYGSNEVPRAFKIESATRESSFMRGTWYAVTGRYLEYDGEIFGLGTTYNDVDQWKGPKKITSLSCYPMKYHRNEAAIRKTLIERGRKFITLSGQHHMCMTGLAFYKRKKAVIKVNITAGRVMISPALFRRINPNYPISEIKRRTEEEDDDSMDECSDSDCCCHGDNDSGQENANQGANVPLGGEEAPEKTVRRFIKDPKTGKFEMVVFTVDADGDVVMPSERLEREGEEKAEFTDEELLIAAPVVLGFAFSEKLWLELSLEGIEDIKWQPEAFESLVLSTPTHKAVMRALVEMNRDKFQSTKNIQDVVQKKGAGLIAVLHGPPGTGKTLTAEGIAELLQCPLYQVSAGELGTDPRTLEAELNKLLDITHSWNAILLLDEADVFLEQRQASDIHRNALVSIFLRLLEYHQGILMMTTNRVETFDEAFQSRIHIALRYAELTPKARKAIWTTFLTKAHEKDDAVSFTEEDYTALARRSLNGRQIKNTVRTGISLALSRKESLNMATLKEVLEVQEDFERDLKGGSGYKDAMASYF